MNPAKQIDIGDSSYGDGIPGKINQGVLLMPAGDIWKP